MDLTNEQIQLIQLMYRYCNNISWAHSDLLYIILQNKKYAPYDKAVLNKFRNQLIVRARHEVKIKNILNTHFGEVPF